MTIANLAFYRFTPIDEPHSFAAEVRSKCLDHELLGTVLIGNEGLNGMLAGDTDASEAFLDWLREQPGFEGLPVKLSESEDVPFGKLVVRVKREIVTMREPDVDATQKTAPHLPPEQLRDWLRGGEDVVLIDTRNDYEYALGTFRGAIDPNTSSFGQFPAWVREHRDDLEGKKVVMFCTGGIRCEKATSWMLDEGFEQIWQLEGGVLNYFDRVDDAERDWEGELFVFDDRVAVDTRLAETDATLCEECGVPIRSDGTRLCDCE